MKSTFGQITAADLKKGVSWIRLNKKRQMDCSCTCKNSKHCKQTYRH